MLFLFACFTAFNAFGQVKQAADTVHQINISSVKVTKCLPYQCPLNDGTGIWGVQASKKQSVTFGFSMPENVDRFEFDCKTDKFGKWEYIIYSQKKGKWAKVQKGIFYNCSIAEHIKLNFRADSADAVQIKFRKAPGWIFIDNMQLFSN